MVIRFSTNEGGNYKAVVIRADGEIAWNNAADDFADITAAFDVDVFGIPMGAMHVPGLYSCQLDTAQGIPVTVTIYDEAGNVCGSGIGVTGDASPVAVNG
jgi:hypothetical protein